MENRLGVEDFELLLETNRLLSSKLELSELLYSIMDLASRVMKVEASSVLLLDEKKKELYLDIAVGVAEEKVKGIRIPVGQGIAGAAVHDEKSLIVNDVKKDSRWKGAALLAESDFDTKSILASPLRVKGYTVGVIEAINKVDGSGFNVFDQELFEAFASQAAICVENAKLYTNLRVEKEKIEKVFKEMADSAVMVTPEGEVLGMNNQASRLLGEGRIANLKDLEALGYFFSPSLGAIFNDPGRNGSFEARRRDPQLLILSGTWSRFGTDGDGECLFLFRDVTQERKEELIRKSFLSVISHKLRTPLVAITGYLPFLREDQDKFTDANRRALDAIDKESRHLSYLIEDLIRFSTVAGVVDFDGIAQNRSSAHRLMEDALSKAGLLVQSYKVAVTKKLDSESQVIGDTVLLIDTLRSLIENAVKFNDKPNKTLNLKVEAAGDRVHFAIEDNGPGIPPEERDRIFRGFHQIESDFTGQVQGMGLGLAFVKKVVELHRGNVELSSKVGQGSTFTVVLPKA
ncbi:MAG: GAF domain-containing protein [Elusimicrobia bacterium]|nr:GAF domain-containing protein [Elusimicrobiota bacterium]